MLTCFLTFLSHWGLFFQLQCSFWYDCSMFNVETLEHSKHFIRNMRLMLCWSYFALSLNSSWHELHKVSKTFFEILMHVDIITSGNCFRFANFDILSILQLSKSTEPCACGSPSASCFNLLCWDAFLHSIVEKSAYLSYYRLIANT